MKKIILFACIITLLSNCAIILGPKKQSIPFRVSTNESKVVCNGDTVNSNSNNINVDKAFTTVFLTNHKQGYLDEVIMIDANKNSNLVYATSAIGAITMVYLFQNGEDNDALFYSSLGLILSPFWESSFVAKARRYKINEPCEFPPLIKIHQRDSLEKYLFVDNTHFNWGTGDFTVNYYNSLRRFNKGKKSTFSNRNTTEVSGESFGLTEQLNKMLYDNGLTDTTEQFMSNGYKSIYIDCDIQKGSIDVVEENREYSIKAGFVQADLSIKWSLKDIYKKEILSKEIKTKSIPVSLNSEPTSALDNALMRSLFTFLSHDDVVEVMKASKKEEVNNESENWDEIDLNSVSYANGINEAIQSVVTIKVEDGHGSGCIISSDGYIVTNFHVLVGLSEVQVVLNNGDELTGKVIRTDPVSDLALIKVDKNFDKHLEIILTNDLGEDVFAIGTPKNIQLGQTVSKGIISGQRNFDGLEYLQTDVSINQGNSGGALVNANGQLIGVVNAKMMGVGVEGIGFAIPSEYLYKQLKINKPKHE